MKIQIKHRPKGKVKSLYNAITNLLSIDNNKDVILIGDNYVIEMDITENQYNMLTEKMKSNIEVV